MNDRLARAAWLVLAFILAVILWGAVVRATGSGAGCGGHWPLCNGEVVPRAPAADTLVEYAHRATSGLALVAVLGLTVAAFRTRPKGHPARAAALLSGLLILTEAALGAALVIFDLVAENRSTARAVVMAIHLANTFLLLGALALTAHWAGGGAPPRWRARAAGAAGLLVGLAGIMLIGTSGAIAALGDTLFPASSLAQALQQDLSPTAHALVRLRWLHPVLAILGGLALFALAYGVSVKRPGVSRYARWTMGLVVCQVLAGIVNVALLAPLWLQVVHLLLADLLWVALVLWTFTELGGAASHPPSA